MKQKLLGIGSVIFPIYVIAAMVALIVLAPNIEPDARIPERLIPLFAAGMIFLFISVIGIWFFIIYDIIHTAKNKSLSGGAKACWIIAIWFLNIIIIPIYWFVHIRKTTEQAVPGYPPQGVGSPDP